MKKIIFFILLTSYIFALNLKQQCPNKIYQYPNAKKYVLRFEDYFNDYGCDLLPLYSTLDKVKKDNVLDYIDDHPDSLPYLIKLAKQYPNFLIALADNDDFVNFLKKAEYDKQFFYNILYILKFVNSNVYKNPENIKFIYFAAYDEKTPKDAYKSYLQLKQIPSKFISPLSISYLILKKQFPEIQKKKIITAFIELENQLSYKELELLSEYSPEYLITFLYNTKMVKDFSSYQKEMVFIYKKLFDKYQYQPNSILKYTFNISPYLIEQNIKYTPTFREIFSDFINKDMFETLVLDSNKVPNLCSDENGFGIFAHNNLSKLINFVNNEKDLYIRYMQDVNSFKGNKKEKKVFNLFALTNLYFKYYPSAQWEMIKGILTTNLFPPPYKNLVKKIDIINMLEMIDYFNTLSKKDDWNYNVKVDSEDSKSVDAPKYLYILFTSVKTQNSSSFLEILLKNPKEAKTKLKKLANSSIEDLAEHRFTLLEKGEYYADIADKIITASSIVVSLALAPETGGGSLAILMEIQATKKGAEKAIKIAGKKAIKKAYLNKIKKYTKKYISKNTIKYYTKRYQEKFYKKTGKKIEKKLDKLEDKVDFFSNGMDIGAALFLKDLKFKQICKGE